MKRVDLEVHSRDLGQEAKKNPNQLRREGWIPAVLYGHGDPVAVVVNRKEFRQAVKTEAGVNAIFNVTLKGQAALGVIKELQRDIFTQEPIHVDFFRINVKEKLEVHVPVHVMGEALGVKEKGGILEHLQREVLLKCLPELIPPIIDVDVSLLDLHQSIKVQDLKFADGIEVLTPGGHIIANVVSPRAEEEPTPAVVEDVVPGAVAAGPEVIAKGKKEEEGAVVPGATAAPAGKDQKESKDKKEAKK